MFNFKKKLKVSYLVSVIFPTGLWALLCGAFGAFLILSRANFEATGTRMIFIITFPINMALTVLLAFLEYGGLRIIGVRKEKKDIQILNDNIIEGKLTLGLPTETVKRIFYSLIERPKDALRIGFKYGFLIIFLTLSVEWLVSRKITNFPIILVSGTFSYVLVALFGSFFAERSIYPVIKQCREILINRGEKIKEPQLKDLRSKFNYFLLLPLLIVASILTFIPSVNLNIIVFSGLGLIMAVTVNQVISSSICEAFLEVEGFARELPKGKKITFSTGSLNKEIISMSESVNKASNEIYISRKETEKRTKELEKSYQEIKKRKDELERFYNLTVGRELKMVELKKEIQELKEKLAEKDKPLAA